MMDRREFLTIMGAASAAGLTPAFATAAISGGAVIPPMPDN